MQTVRRLRKIDDLNQFSRYRLDDKRPHAYELQKRVRKIPLVVLALRKLRILEPYFQRRVSESKGPEGG